MDFEAMAYPEVITINGTEYKACRNKNSVLVPYTDEPDIGIGDIITQRAGLRQITLKVLDASFLPGGTLNVGTHHNNILTLEVENMTANEHKIDKQSSVVNIGSINGTQVQIGNNNSQITNITVQELIEKIASSDDKEAKSMLKKLLENSTVASLIGAGASALFTLL